eukprot:c5500_g1_i1 orf=110-805(+)
MSLALVQGYSSEEEVQERFSSSESEDEDSGQGSPVLLQEETLEGHPSVTAFPPISSTHASPLPSAATIFSEVTGPPEFLKDTVGAAVSFQPGSRSRKFPHGSKLLSNSRPRKELPAGAVVEAKPQVGALPVHGDQDTKKDEPRKPPTAGMPPAEDAAKLLGMCLQCSVPKTYSAAKEGLVCPLCKDRPAVDNDARRGSKIKDKERNKRMKGQSSHATWKSETEMHLRQQFD